LKLGPSNCTLSYWDNSAYLDAPDNIYLRPDAGASSLQLAGTGVFSTKRVVAPAFSSHQLHLEVPARSNFFARMWVGSTAQSIERVGPSSDVTYWGGGTLQPFSLYALYAAWSGGVHVCHTTMHIITGPTNRGVNGTLINYGATPSAPNIIGVTYVGNAYPPAPGNNWLKVTWDNWTDIPIRASLTLTKIGGGMVP
jgi:hypothetical protein